MALAPAQDQGGPLHFRWWLKPQTHGEVDPGTGAGGKEERNGSWCQLLQRAREGLQCPLALAIEGHQDCGDSNFGFLARRQRPDCSELSLMGGSFSSTVKGEKVVLEREGVVRGLVLFSFAVKDKRDLRMHVSRGRAAREGRRQGAIVMTSPADKCPCPLPHWGTH